MTFPWLTTLIALPALGAVLTALVPSGRGTLAKQVATGFALLTLVVGALISIQFLFDVDMGVESETYEWIPELGASWALDIHGISLALVALTVLATPIVALAMWHEAEEEKRDPKAFFALLLSVEALTLTAFLSQDVLLFYVVFEAMLIPLYFMIGMYGGPQRRYAAVKFLLYNLVGGLAMLAAVIGLYVQSVDAGNRRSTCPTSSRWTSTPPPSGGCSSGSCWRSRSRRRCGRSTPGCPTPPPRRHRRTRRSCPASPTRSAPTA